MRHSLNALCLTFGTVLLLGASGTASAQNLPGGASSLTEAHGDWTVTCTMPNGQAKCLVSQLQVNSESRQRVLSMELTAADGDNVASGTLMLPFGLLLDAGAVLSVDENAPLPALRFSTCIPAGCVVPLAFDTTSLSTMQAGKALNIKVAANGSGQEVAFSISLSGFTSALARATELGRP